MHTKIEVDLHLHTTASDGTLSPADVVRRAKNRGMKVIAITDHDTLGGIAEGLAESEQHGIIVVPGVELSVHQQDIEIHIIGYFLDYSSPALLNRLEELQKARLERAHKILEKLERLNVHLPIEYVQSFSKGESIGRPHIAQALKNRGFVHSTQEAFKRYIGRGCPAFHPRFKISAGAGIEMIQNAGGIPVLAHPGISKRDDLIPLLKEQGIEGIEAYYSEHSGPQVENYVEIAKKYDLLITGGSDFHGTGTSIHADIGESGPPFEDWLILEKRARTPS